MPVMFDMSPILSSLEVLSKRALVVFVQSPRLEARAKPFGTPSCSRQIHQELLIHTLRTVEEAQRLTSFDVIIASDAPAELKILREATIVQNNQVSVQNGEQQPCATTYIKQSGRTFGERLCYTLQVFTAYDYEHVLVIGADTPELLAQDLQQAWQALCTSDVVLGQASDGGVYLIGGRQTGITELLDAHLPWQTSSIWKELVERCQLRGFKAEILRVLDDLDNRSQMYRWLRQVHREEELSESSQQRHGVCANKLSENQAKQKAKSDCQHSTSILLASIRKLILLLLSQSQFFAQEYSSILPFLLRLRLSLQYQKAPPVPSFVYCICTKVIL
jgi:glycosyltransferase A (GT-A) superfamily protein (DUF2064 family)